MIPSGKADHICLWALWDNCLFVVSATFKASRRHTRDHPPAIDIFLWLLSKLCCEKFFCKVSSCGNNISMYNLRMWYNKKKDINLQYLKKVSCIFGNVWILCWRSLCCPYYMFSTFELFSGSLVCCYFRTRWRLWILIFCEISHHRNHCYYIKVEYLNLFNSLADIILKNRTMKIKTIQI